VTSTFFSVGSLVQLLLELAELLVGFLVLFERLGLLGQGERQIGVSLRVIDDARGFFARTWTPGEFETHGLNPHIAQCSISYNRRRGTVRGMHYQMAPYEEAKVVRCTRGSIYDVAVDLRRDSPTASVASEIELSERNRAMFYIPEGFAHGFCVTSEYAVVAYKCTELYHPETELGVSWNDPDLAIDWPLASVKLSDRDRALPRLREIARERLPVYRELQAR